jgi:hypothetical protein
MLSLYSNYDYREKSQLYPEGRGALRANQQYIANAQEVPNNVTGLLIIVKTDVQGICFIDFTNSVSYPYEFTQQETIYNTHIIQVPIRAKNFRIRYVNGPSDQSILTINTYLIYNAQLMSGIDYNGTSRIMLIDDTGIVYTRISRQPGNTIAYPTGFYTGLTPSYSAQPQINGTNISIFGTSDVSNNLTVQYSVDQNTWFNTKHIIPCGSTDFNYDFICSSPYIRLITDIDATMTCYISMIF